MTLLRGNPVAEGTISGSGSARFQALVWVEQSPFALALRRYLRFGHSQDTSN